MTTQNTENTDHCKAAAKAVEEQLLADPGLGIPVDPDVAEFMGAFREDAVSLEDIDYENGGGDAA